MQYPEMDESSSFGLLLKLEADGINVLSLSTKYIMIDTGHIIMSTYDFLFIVNVML